MSIKFDLKTPQPGRFSFGEQIGLSTALLLFAAAWLVPLLIPPWVSWHHEVLSFVAVFLLSGVALWQRARLGFAQGLGVTSGSVLLMGLILLTMAQMISGISIFAGDAFILALYFFLMMCCWMLGAGQIAANSLALLSTMLPVAAGLMLLVALGSAVIALAQVMDVWDGVSWINRMPQLRRPGANLGQPNQLATLLLMGLASLAYLYERGRLSAMPAGLVCMSLSLAMAATESRTGLLSFLMLGGWWLVMRRRAGLHMPRIVLALVSTCFLCLFWFWPAFMAFIGQLEGGATVNTSPGLRLVVWPQLMEAIGLHPWLGWGLREVSEAHNAVVHAYAVSEPFTYAHNVVLDMAIGMGIPLTLLLLGMSVVWLWRRIHAVKDLHTWYCVAAVLPVAVHSMLEFPFAYAYFLAPVMFFLGVLDGTTGGKAVARINIKWVGAGWLIFAALGAWSVVEYLRIEEDFRIVRFESLRLGKTPEGYERPSIVLLTQLSALLEGGRIVPAPGMPPERLELARKVALRFPWPATQHRYALSLALNGQAEEAIRQLRVIRALHGEKTYMEIRSNWEALAQSKYPQLREMKLP